MHCGEFIAVRCTANPSTVSILDMPKFSKFFRTPWTVGGQFGYALSCNARLFIEFDYYQARLKDKCGCPCFSIINVPLPTDSIQLCLGKYKAWDFYGGARYYWDRWCDRLSLFLGGKIGLRHHKRIQLTGNLTNTSGDSEIDFFRKSTMVAGGGHIGLDYCIWGNFSVVLTAEVVASCGPRAVDSILLSDVDAFRLDASNLLPARIGTELMFPITLGLRYSF